MFDYLKIREQIDIPVRENKEEIAKNEKRGELSRKYWMEDEEGPQRRRKNRERGLSILLEKHFQPLFPRRGSRGLPAWKNNDESRRLAVQRVLFSRKVVNRRKWWDYFFLSLSLRCRVSFESFCSILPFLGSLIRNFTLKFSVLSNF